MSEPTSPASMGEPLSEADRIAEIRRTLKMAKLASANAPGTFWHTFTENTEFLLGKVESLLAHNGVLVTEVRFQAERADSFRSERDAATARVGVLEGQLATAQEQLAPFTAQHRPCKNMFRTCVTCRDGYGEPLPWPCRDARRLGLVADCPACAAPVLTDTDRECPKCDAKIPARALGLDGGGSDA